MEPFMSDDDSPSEWKCAFCTERFSSHWYYAIHLFAKHGLKQKILFWLS